MPAKSQAQQKLMGMAYALKKGDVSSKDVSQEVQDLADSMTLKQLKDYAATPHKNLPQYVEEAVLTGFTTAGPVVRYNTFAANAAVAAASISRDRLDPLIQSFIDFISQKDSDVDEAVAAITPPGIAQTANTPGMGNVTTPSTEEPGSGDRFDNIGILSYEDYKKWLKSWKKKNKKPQDG